MQVWAPDRCDGVWTARLRVGDIGGQPGQLGYYGAVFFSLSLSTCSTNTATATKGGGGGGGEGASGLSGGGVGLMAHGHNGAFFAWRPRVGGKEGAEGEGEEVGDAYGEACILKSMCT
jgi:hypothetical protein